MSSPFFETEFSRKLKTYMWNGIDVDFAREGEQVELPDDAEQQLPADPLAPGEVAGPSTLYDPANWSNLEAYYPSDSLLNNKNIEDTVNSNNAVGPTSSNFLTDTELAQSTGVPKTAYRASDDTLWVLDSGNEEIFEVNQSDGSMTSVFTASNVETTDFNSILAFTWDPDAGVFWLVGDDGAGGNTKIVQTDETGAVQSNPATFTTTSKPQQGIGYSQTNTSIFTANADDSISEWTSSIFGSTDPTPEQNASPVNSVYGIGEIGSEVWVIYDADGSDNESQVVKLDQTDLSEIERTTVLRQLIGLAGVSVDPDTIWSIDIPDSGNNQVVEVQPFNKKPSLTLTAGVGGTDAIGYDNISGVQSASIGMPSVLDISGSTDATIACWFNLADKSAFRPFVTVDETNSGNVGLVIGYNPSVPGLFFNIQDDTGTGVMVTGADPSINTWYFVAGVVNSSSGNLELYFDDPNNGANTTVFGTSIGTDVGTGNWHIGGAPTQSTTIDGSLDEIQIWPNKALTQTELSTIYDKGI